MSRQSTLILFVMLALNAASLALAVPSLPGSWKYRPSSQQKPSHSSNSGNHQGSHRGSSDMSSNGRHRGSSSHSSSSNGHNRGSSSHSDDYKHGSHPYSNNHRGSSSQSKEHHYGSTSQSNGRHHASSHRASSAHHGSHEMTAAGGYCGFVVTPDEVNSSERKFARMRRTQRAAGDDLDPITIPVHFHVIAANETMEGGWVHDSQLQLSIDILNRDYATAMITWELAEITRTINEEWFTSANIWPQAQIDLAQEMKSELRAGDEGDLNVYTVGFVKEAKEVEGLLGVATFPSNYTETPMEDGIMMKYSTLPGGVNPTYNRGFVLTHEAGHWVGLYHTFQGGCEGDGDLVDDTPAQGGPSRVTFQGGCVPTDTCENLPGVDLISNFMDYSEELCKSTTFTDGQIRRMRDELSAFRGYD